MSENLYLFHPITSKGFILKIKRVGFIIKTFINCDDPPIMSDFDGVTTLIIPMIQSKSWIVLSELDPLLIFFL